MSLADLFEQIVAWKAATGLQRGGDPDAVTPQDLVALLEKYRRLHKFCDELVESMMGARGYGRDLDSDDCHDIATDLASLLSELPKDAP